MTRRFRILRAVVVVAWSTIVWTALWSDLTIANVFWGAVIGALTLLLVPLAPERRHVPVRPVEAVKFAVYFAWALIQASAVVAWEVITPGSQINAGIVAAPLRTRSPGLTTLIANAISLTPGTLTLEVRAEPPTLYVHILHLRTIEQVREDIRRLEDRALSAFPVAEEERTR